MNSATEPSTREETRLMNENISKIAVATTADTIWFPDNDEPSMPIARAAAPCRTSPIYALITGPVSGLPKNRP